MPILFSILFLTAPLYVWRFSVGGMSTDFLMIFSFIVILIAKFVVFKNHKFSVAETWRSYIKDIVKINRVMLIGIICVIIASVISLFTFGFSASKLAQWIVLYFEPIALFFIVRHFTLRGSNKSDGEVLTRNYNAREYLSFAAYLLLFAAGVLAVIQYHTLATLPMAWWGNANEPKRAIAFFADPNAYALFVTPLLAWLIPDVVSSIQTLQKVRTQFNWTVVIRVVAWLVGALGMFLTLSRGAWLGLLVAAGLYVLLTANKKMFLWFGILLVALIILVAAVPNLRYRVILPFYGEKSATARISLFHTGSEMVKDNPILGKGINGFDDNWDKYNTDPNLEHYNFPHNIFLNFWIDLGLLGLLGMLLIFVSGIWEGIKNRRDPVALGLLLFLAAIAVHGLIDIPYLKNDLALVFWLVLAVSI